MVALIYSLWSFEKSDPSDVCWSCKLAYKEFKLVCLLNSCHHPTNWVKSVMRHQLKTRAAWNEPTEPDPTWCLCFQLLAPETHAPVFSPPPSQKYPSASLLLTPPPITPTNTLFWANGELVFFHSFTFVFSQPSPPKHPHPCPITPFYPLVCGPSLMCRTAQGDPQQASPRGPLLGKGGPFTSH